jgi:hypothetical protein
MVTFRAEARLTQFCHIHFLASFFIFRECKSANPAINPYKFHVQRLGIQLDGETAFFAENTILHTNATTTQVQDALHCRYAWTPHSTAVIPAVLEKSKVGGDSLMYDMLRNQLTLEEWGNFLLMNGTWRTMNSPQTLSSI